MTVEDFSFSWQTNLHFISSIDTFQAENLHFVVLFLFQIGMQELYIPWYIQTFQLPLQSQWYTRPSGFLTQSFDQSESSEVNQIRRSIFFPFLFSFLYVYEMLARPTLGLFSIENVLNLHAPLHCTAVHNFRQKRVFIICPIQMIFYTKLYDILRISDGRRPTHSSRMLWWPEPAK